MIDGKSLFDQPVKNDIKIYDNNWLSGWLCNELFTRLSLFQKLLLNGSNRFK